MPLETIQPLHRRLWQWVRDQIVQPVPEDSALCEFDCRKQECNEEEWANCERRKQNAAGEWWPESQPATAGKANPGAAPPNTAA